MDKITQSGENKGVYAILIPVWSHFFPVWFSNVIVVTVISYSELINTLRDNSSAAVFHKVSQLICRRQRAEVHKHSQISA